MFVGLPMLVSGPRRRAPRRVAAARRARWLATCWPCRWLNGRNPGKRSGSTPTHSAAAAAAHALPTDAPLPVSISALANRTRRQGACTGTWCGRCRRAAARRPCLALLGGAVACLAVAVASLLCPPSPCRAQGVCTKYKACGALAGPARTGPCIGPGHGHGAWGMGHGAWAKAWARAWAWAWAWAWGVGMGQGKGTRAWA